MSNSEQALASIEKMFSGPHDCGPKSLLRVVPGLDPEDVKEAFRRSSDNWPYKGITNREFAIAIRHLRERKGYDLSPEYRSEDESLEDLLSRKPARCVALLKRHYIAIRDGAVLGRETLPKPYAQTEVVCSWTFS